MGLEMTGMRWVEPEMGRVVSGMEGSVGNGQGRAGNGPSRAGWVPRLWPQGLYKYISGPTLVLIIHMRFG